MIIAACILFSILLVGFFSGIETAFISINKLSVELKKKQGRRSGYILSDFLDRPSRFVGTCLVGFNVFLIIYCLLLKKSLAPIFGSAASTDSDFEVLLKSFKLVLFVILSSGLVLIFEVIFKAIFKAKSDGALNFFATTIRFFNRFFGWIAVSFVKLSQWLLKYIFNLNVNEQKQTLSHGDLEHYFQQTNENEDEKQELNKELFENALSLSSVRIRSCMVPRKEIIAVDKNTPLKEITNKMIDTRLSRIVIFDGTIDSIIGYIHQLDLFKQPKDIQSILLPIPAVPESMTATGLITKLAKEQKSIAWVVDEFGGTSGIVTMEDLLEEIFGEIKDEYDTEELVDKQLAEKEYMFSGRIELDFLNEKYDFDFPSGDYETLSGYIINRYGTLPAINAKVIIDSYQFDIINRNDTRIELVKMKLL